MGAYSKLHQAQANSEAQRRRRLGKNNGGPLLGIATAIGFDAGPQPSPFTKCQWIDAEVPEGGSYAAAPFCGAPTAGPRASYCPSHHARAYVGRPPPKDPTRFRDWRDNRS